MPSISYTDAPDWLQWLIGLAIVIAAVLAVVGFIRKIWPLLVVFVTTVNSLGDLPRFMVTTAATLEAQDKQLEDIHHQTHENNGGSLKDALKRVEKNQANALEELARIPEIEKGVAGLYERADAADQSDAEIREEIERTRPKPPPRKRVAKPKETP